MSRSEIAAVNRQFEDAARKADLDRLASLYTPDAMALPPDGPIVTGRDSIKQMWGSVAQQMGLKDVRLSTLDFEQAGDTGYEVGEATLTLSGGTAVCRCRGELVRPMPDARLEWLTIFLSDVTIADKTRAMYSLISAADFTRSASGMPGRSGSFLFPWRL